MGPRFIPLIGPPARILRKNWPPSKYCRCSDDAKFPSSQKRKGRKIRPYVKYHLGEGFEVSRKNLSCNHKKSDVPRLKAQAIGWEGRKGRTNRGITAGCTAAEGVLRGSNHFVLSPSRFRHADLKARRVPNPGTAQTLHYPPKGHERITTLVLRPRLHTAILSIPKRNAVPGSGHGVS